jgi:hypothetical protein
MINKYIGAIQNINEGYFEAARNVADWDKYPFMLREAEWIKSNGYNETYDPLKKIFLWIKN